MKFHMGFEVHLSLKSKQMKSVSHEFEEIQLELEELQDGWEDAVRFHLTLLLLQINRCAASFQIPRTYRKIQDATLTASVLQLISEHYADPDFSIKKCLRRFFTNQSTISRSFREVMWSVHSFTSKIHLCYSGFLPRADSLYKYIKNLCYSQVN